MLHTYMRIAPTHILLDRILSQATWAALRSDEAIKARRRPPRDPLLDCQHNETGVVFVPSQCSNERETLRQSVAQFVHFLPQLLHAAGLRHQDVESSNALIAQGKWRQVWRMALTRAANPHFAAQMEWLHMIKARASPSCELCKRERGQGRAAMQSLPEDTVEHIQSAACTAQKKSVMGAHNKCWKYLLSDITKFVKESCIGNPLVTCGRAQGMRTGG
jgi:hypothetical protein